MTYFILNYQHTLTIKKKIILFDTICHLETMSPEFCFKLELYLKYEFF